MQRHRRLVREGVLRNEVHAAEFRRVHSDLARRLVHHPLQKIGGFRTAGAAIGVDRSGGCRHALHVGVNGRDLVAARQQRGMQDRRRHNREGRQVGADIGHAVDTKTCDPVVLVERHPHLVDVIPAMRVGKEGFAAVGGPFDRPLQLLAGPGADRFFRIDIDLRSETAADIGCHDAEFRLRNAEHERPDHKPCQMRVLRGREQRVGLVDRIILGQGRAWFHGIRDQAVVANLQLDDCCG